MTAVFPIPAAVPLPNATHLGRVHLDVADLDRQLEFYTEVIGLHLLGRSGSEARLGAGGRELLRLTLKPGARRYEGHAGLYHFCLAVPDRRDFGRLLRRVMDSGLELHGLVDHHAAEAIYLPDPEGNGVELNWDRPREVWAKAMAEIALRGNGPLDVEGLLDLADAAGPGDGKLPADAYVGHIHLHVADLQAGREFYHGTLGFDIMAEFPRAAVFTSAGGYHHHIAFNIWNGRGAAAAPPDATGLHDFTVLLPSAAELEALAERLRAAGKKLDAHPEGGWVLRDPAGNAVRLAC
jgi:catechol 2,3-dioxygenase